MPYFFIDLKIINYYLYILFWNMRGDWFSFSLSRVPGYKGLSQNQIQFFGKSTRFNTVQPLTHSIEHQLSL
jgi:hypothetical protein